MLTNFSKLPNIKFHENPFSGSQSCYLEKDCWTDKYGEANMQIVRTFHHRNDKNKYYCTYIILLKLSAL
jgi:hypothetical protein